MVHYPATAERWGVFEVALPGRTDGNPFADHTITGRFTHPAETVTADGFYDGDGTYKVRFMPSFEGEYRFEVGGSFADEATAGCFTATPAGAGNHGPVRVNGFHFAYEDGTPYTPVGTTAYVWALQSEDLQRQTLAELAKGYFNKMRFCVLPKHYLYNLHEPISYPYEGTPCPFSFDPDGDFGAQMRVQPGNRWNFTRFNPAHFRNVERAITRLGELGIEADLIVMHPYDRWGFSQMSAEQDDLYWRYCAARFSAFRNVWWSLANEYDLMPQKTLADWERYAAILVEKDPYRHLRSIHNCRPHYDFTRPWVTHCSIQRNEQYKCAEYTADYRTRYQKPVVLDEIVYEGNIQRGWGNISAQELVRRFWEATARGGYATHGETYTHPQDILWWSHGGALHGESPARLRFLKDEILAKLPGGAGLRPVEFDSDEVAATLERAGKADFYLIYYGFNRPSQRQYHLDDTSTWRAEVIDTWNMTIEDAGLHRGRFTLPLPGREYMALRLTRVPG